MKMRSINPTNINRLRNAFYDYLLENGVPFNKIGLGEEGEKLVLFFERDESLNVFELEKEMCIGHEPTFVAESVIEPMLNHLKGIKE